MPDFGHLFIYGLPLFFFISKILLLSMNHMWSDSSESQNRQASTYGASCMEENITVIITILHETRQHEGERKREQEATSPPR